MTYPVTVPDWNVYDGDTFSQTYVITDSATGLPVNLTGWGSWASAWRPYQGGELVMMTVVTTGLASGQITIIASSAQTTAMDGPGLWDVQSTNTSTGAVRTWLRGKVAYVQNVTP